MNKDKKTPKIGIIVISWNNADILPGCYDSIKLQTYFDQSHTILVDNGSADDSIEITTKDYPWVEVIAAGKNLAFAKGNNKGIEHLFAKYPEMEYIVLLNSDARLSKNWLETVYDFAKTKPNGALFQSTTLDYYDEQIIDSTHIYISQNGSGTQAGWRNDYFGEVGPRKVYGANAAAVMVSVDFIKKQPMDNYFDPKLFMYLEDVDVAARAVVCGWDNYLVPKTHALHMGSASSNKVPGFSLYMTYRNNLAVLLKNIPFPLVWRMLPDMVKSDYHTIKHLRRIGQSKGIRPLVKGRIVGFFRLPLFLPEIIKLHTYRKQASKEYIWSLMKKGY